MSLKMSESEREEFLAGVHVGVVAIAREGLGTLATPTWYGYRPGGEVELWMLGGTLKERLIRTAGRFSLCAQDENPPYKYVSVEGPVVSWEEASRERVGEMASRYMPADEVPGYLDESLFDGSLLVHMRPERWFSMDEAKAS